MELNCCVSNCSSDKDTFIEGSRIVLYPIPIEKKLKELWIKNCNISQETIDAKKNKLRICELHFKKEDFNGKKKLNKKAVPTVFAVNENDKDPPKNGTESYFGIDYELMAVPNIAESVKISRSKSNSSVVVDKSFQANGTSSKLQVKTNHALTDHEEVPPKKKSKLSSPKKKERIFENNVKSLKSPEKSVSKEKKNAPKIKETKITEKLNKTPTKMEAKTKTKPAKAANLKDSSFERTRVTRSSKMLENTKSITDVQNNISSKVNNQKNENLINPIIETSNISTIKKLEVTLVPKVRINKIETKTVKSSSKSKEESKLTAVDSSIVPESSVVLDEKTKTTTNKIEEKVASNIKSNQKRKQTTKRKANQMCEESIESRLDTIDACKDLNNSVQKQLDTETTIIELSNGQQKINDTVAEESKTVSKEPSAKKSRIVSPVPSIITIEDSPQKVIVPAEENSVDQENLNDNLITVSLEHNSQVELPELTNSVINGNLVIFQGYSKKKPSSPKTIRLLIRIDKIVDGISDVNGEASEITELSNELDNTVVTSKTPYQCVICDEEFDKTTELYKHLKTHYSCNYCHKEFQYLSDLNVHLEMHKKGAADTHQDKDISQNLNVLSLPDHPEIHKQNKSRDFGNKVIISSAGPKENSSIDIMNNSTIIGNIIPIVKFNCQLCNKEFTNIAEIGLHTQIHVNEMQRQNINNN